MKTGTVRCKRCKQRFEISQEDIFELQRGDFFRYCDDCLEELGRTEPMMWLDPWDREDYLVWDGD